MKLSKFFYNVARKAGKASTISNDIETLATGNPKKIAKRFGRKMVGKVSNKVTKSIINKKPFK